MKYTLSCRVDARFQLLQLGQVLARQLHTQRGVSVRSGPGQTSTHVAEQLTSNSVVTGAELGVTRQRVHEQSADAPRVQKTCQQGHLTPQRRAAAHRTSAYSTTNWRSSSPCLRACSACARPPAGDVRHGMTRGREPGDVSECLAAHDLHEFDVAAERHAGHWGLNRRDLLNQRRRAQQRRARCFHGARWRLLERAGGAGATPQPLPRRGCATGDAPGRARAKGCPAARRRVPALPAGEQRPADRDARLSFRLRDGSHRDPAAGGRGGRSGPRCRVRCDTRAVRLLRCSEQPPVEGGRARRCPRRRQAAQDARVGGPKNHKGKLIRSLRACRARDKRGT